MSILRLFDVSQYISAGPKSNRLCRGVIEDCGRYRANDMPCGGISFLLNTVTEFADVDTDLVYVFDRTPTIKRKIYNETFNSRVGYKGNRPAKDKSIPIQRELAEEIIKQIGLQTIAADGYEADDCIATIVGEYKYYYDKIYIHSRDSDLYYLVDDNVEVMPVGTNGKTVNLTNWEDTVISGYITPFNTLLLNKLIMGEPGDNIPHISKEMADRIMAYIPERLYENCGDTEMLRKWVSNATDNNRVVMGTLNLLIPLVVPVADIELDDYELDRDILKYFQTVTGNKYCRGRQAAPYPLGEEVITQYLEEYNRR